MFLQPHEMWDVDCSGTWWGWSIRTGTGGEIKHWQPNSCADHRKSNQQGNVNPFVFCQIWSQYLFLLQKHSLRKVGKTVAHCSAHNGLLCLCIFNFGNRALQDFTSGYSMGEVWTAGEQFYLSPEVAFTNRITLKLLGKHSRCISLLFYLHDKELLAAQHTRTFHV